MAQQARDKPGVYRTFTSQFCLRLSDEQMRRVHKAASHRTKSVSDFIRDAVMSSVFAVEDDLDARKREKADAEARGFVPRNPAKSRGLGLVPKAEQVVDAQPVPQVPTIVINNGPQARPATASDIDVLADFVLSAKNTVEREERERQVKNIILAVTPENEDRAKIAKSLDERIAEKSPKTEKKAGWSFLTGAR